MPPRHQGSVPVVGVVGGRKDTRRDPRGLDDRLSEADRRVVDDMQRDGPLPREVAGPIVGDVLQEGQEYGLERRLPDLCVVGLTTFVLIELAGEEPLTLGPDLASTERVLGLPLR